MRANTGPEQRATRATGREQISTFAHFRSAAARVFRERKHVPYLSDLSLICGDALEPIFFSCRCFQRRVDHMRRRRLRLAIRKYAAAVAGVAQTTVPTQLMHNRRKTMGACAATL
jgi:hypothetical protein